MTVVKVNCANPNEVNQFIQFPHQLYRRNPFWVPTLATEMRLTLDRSQHPFYRHSEGDFFVYKNQSDEVLGRIAVLCNRNYCAHHHTRAAFIYYFECVQDNQVAQSLFSAAFEWARARGLETIEGPRGFLRASGVGLLVSGFEHLPAMGIPYNFPYYEAFFEQAGFKRSSDYYSGYVDRQILVPEKIHAAARRILDKKSFWIKTFRSKAEMRTWIPKLNQVHDQAFCNNPGYYPCTPEEFELIAATIVQAADPKLVKLIMKDNDVVGFILAYADVSRAIQRCRGRLWPLGWADILLEQRKSKVANLNGVGVLPEVQGMGANIILYSEMDKTLRSRPLERVEIIQVDERNHRSKADMDRMGVCWHKQHRTYHLAL